MVVMLLAMYVLLELLAAVLRGHSAAGQLWLTLASLRHTGNVITLPLCMMGVGFGVAVWQYGAPSEREGARAQRQAAPEAARGSSGGDGEKGSLTTATKEAAAAAAEAGPA
jgi:hypothetical protein